MRRKLLFRLCGGPRIDNEYAECKKPKKEIPRFSYNAILIVCNLWLIFVYIYFSWSSLRDFQTSILSYWGNRYLGASSSEITVQSNHLTHVCIGNSRTKMYHYKVCTFLKDVPDDCLVLYMDENLAIEDGYKICDICAQNQKWGNT